MLVVLAGAWMGPAAAGVGSTGSDGELFFTTSAAGDPADAIVGGGFWGHEGPDRAGATVVSRDLTDGGTDLDLAKLALVFTPTSADGTAEEPVVTAGQTVAEAYPYFTSASLLTPLRGNPDDADDDQVLLVSSRAEWDAWSADGKPAQAASSDDLVLHDSERPGAPVSVHPMGRSILNRWDTGQAMSAVIVATTGEYVDGVPVVDASSGRAQASWITFTSAVDPAIGDADHQGVATSGAYQLSAGAAPADGSATMTVLSLSAGPLSAGEPIPLTAAVTPATAGTVEFRDGTAVLGSAPVDTSGVAEWSWTATAGDHVLSALFTPEDSGTWSGSRSTPTPVEVLSTRSRSADDQTLAADVPEGALTLSTPYSPEQPLDLGRLVLTPDALTYTGSAPFAEVLVTDTRAGALPWTVTVISTHLSDGAGHTINAQNLGLVDLVADVRSGAGLAAVTDRPGASPPVAASDGGSLGLGFVPKPVLYLTEGPGTVAFSGRLTLAAPVSTSPGHYTATVTFTIA